MPPHQQQADTKPALRGPDSLQPAAPDGGGATEQNEEEGIDPAEIGDTPIAYRREQRRRKRQIGACRRCRDPERFRKRQPEDAEAVSHADAKMYGERCRRHKPAIETRLSNDPLPIKQAKSG